MKSWVGKRVVQSSEWDRSWSRNKLGIVVGYDAKYTYPLIVLWPSTSDLGFLRTNLRKDTQTYINYDIVPGGHFKRRYMAESWVIEAS